jgi:hypothetical protein
MTQAEVVGKLVRFAGRDTDENEPGSDAVKVKVPPFDPTIGTGERDGKSANVMPRCMACGRMGAGLDERDELCGTQRSVGQDMIPVDRECFTTA